MPTFVFNDETIINSYGFRVLNRGGSFARFDGNPVMLNSHQNTTEMTLGSWAKRRIEGFQLKGDTVFDTERDSVKEVEGQVNRGFLKGCSMGLAFSFEDDAWQKAPDGVWELVKWELMEVSICAVPSNSSSLALYNINTGKLIPENEFKLNLSSITGNPYKPNFTSNNSMNFNQVLTVDDFEKLPNEAKLNFKTNNPDAYMRLFDGSKSTHSQYFKNHMVAPPAYNVSEIKSVDDFQKLSDTQKLHFKNTFNSAYLALFRPNNVSVRPDHPTVKTVYDFQNLGHYAQHQFKIDHPELYKHLFAVKK